MNGSTASEATRGFFAALKDQPLSLALVVMNVALLGYLYYQGTIAASQRQAELELLYRNRSEVGQLLAQCYPAPPK